MNAIRVLFALAFLLVGTGATYANTPWSLSSAMTALKGSSAECAGTAEYTTMKVEDLTGYVTRTRIKSLQRMGVDAIPVLTCNGTPRVGVIHTGAGNAPLHWAVSFFGTETGQGDWLSQFLSLNPEVWKKGKDGMPNWHALNPGNWVVPLKHDPSAIKAFESGRKMGKKKTPTAPKPRPAPSTQAQAPVTPGRPQSAPPTRSGETHYRKSGVQSPASASCAEKSAFGYADPECHFGIERPQPAQAKTVERSVPVSAPAPAKSAGTGYTAKEQELLKKIETLAGEPVRTVELGAFDPATGGHTVTVNGKRLSKLASPANAEILAGMNR
jgi:hypothetical protein